MKTRYKVLLIFTLISIVLGAFDPVTYEITESFLIFTMIPKWINISFVIISIFIGIFYSVSLLSHKSVRYISNLGKLFRLIFWIPTLSFGIIAMMFGLFSGGALLANRMIGEQKEIIVTGTIVDTRQNITKYGTSHYVTIKSDNLTIEREIDFKVPNPIPKGHRFQEKMKIGSIGLLYKK